MHDRAHLDTSGNDLQMVSLTTLRRVRQPGQKALFALTADEQRMQGLVDTETAGVGDPAAAGGAGPGPGNTAVQSLRRGVPSADACTHGRADYAHPLAPGKAGA